jgi:hypothetical protein
MDDDLETSNNRSTEDFANRDAPPLVASRLKPFSKLKLSRIRLPKFSSFRLSRTQSDSSAHNKDFIWLLLLLILISYAFISYFLSVLLTIPNQKFLAIAGFAIVATLPTISAFSDFGLLKWGYLLSGFLIVGGLIFLANTPFQFTFLAIMAWAGLTAIAFVGDFLTKKQKLWRVIGILTITCLMGLGIGYQIWRLAASWR